MYVSEWVDGGWMDDGGILSRFSDIVRLEFL